MSLQKLFFCVLLYFMLLCGASASTLQINPVRLSLHQNTPIETIRITNNGEADCTLQLDILSWKQNKEGKDVYQPSADLLVTPPLFTVSMQKTQVVRVALKRPISGSGETAYRLRIREIGGHIDTEESGNKLSIVLETLLPIFVGTPSSLSPTYDWTLQNIKNKHPSITLTNKGVHHFFLTELMILDKNKTLVASKDKLFAYLLPGTTRSFPIDIHSSISEDTELNLFIKN